MGGGGRKKNEVGKKFIINSCHPPPDGVKLPLRIDPDTHTTPLGSEIILIPSLLYTYDPAGVINLNPDQGSDSGEVSCLQKMSIIGICDPGGVELIHGIIYS